MKESRQPVELKEFHTHLYRRMNEFRERNFFCDVNIEINEKLYPCHRIILTAASPFFETLLGGLSENFEQDSRSAVIAVKDVEPLALEEILNAIYSAQLHLLPENVYFILKASHSMQLEIIKNACISWIMENTDDVYYLIDMCLFAKDINEEKLHQKCANTISCDVVRWSQSDSFKDIPFDILNYILSKCKVSKNEERVLLLIIKWSKYNRAKSENVQTLLDSAKLKSKLVSMPIMSELITGADDDVFSMEKSKSTGEEIESNSIFNFNLYLNAVDVKTGAKGWGKMKINDSFEECVMSTFYLNNNNVYRKAVEVRTKLYCFDYNFKSGKNEFSCFDECHNNTTLNLPFHSQGISTFDLMKRDDIIYLIEKNSTNGCIWVYDCASDTWNQSYKQKHEEKKEERYGYNNSVCNNYPTPAYYPATLSPGILLPATPSQATSGCRQWWSGNYYQVEYENYVEIIYEKYSHAFTSSNGILYVIANRSNTGNVILSFDHRSPKPSQLTRIHFDYQNAAVCTFENKIAISGSSSHNIFGNTLNIFDVTGMKWLKGVKPMNFGRANHSLFHRDGFLFAAENGRPLIPNEKYDIKSNEWTNIPALPKRILVENTNDVMIVATADLFGVDVNPLQK